VAVLAELLACAASLDKVKEFSSYAMEGFNSGDTVVVIGSGPLGLLHIAKADMMGPGQIIASDWARAGGCWSVTATAIRSGRWSPTNSGWTRLRPQCVPA
jgi:Zn-dependent alcohol dehydrogenase